MMVKDVKTTAMLSTCGVMTGMVMVCEEPLDIGE